MGMKVCLVNYEENYNVKGILSKFAYEMQKELTRMGIKTIVRSHPDPGADVNHHINYYSYEPSRVIDTLMITHIWEGDKLEVLRKGMETAYGICMSQEMVEWLESKGLTKLTAVEIQPHEQLPRKIKNICITTNVYPDGCKREWMFKELLKTIGKGFHFYIMGSGWEVRGDNITLIDHFEKERYLPMLEKCEYNLYFGKDEGSMGIIDAKQVGLQVIAPELGFVKGLVDYPFDTQEELNAIFKKLDYNPVAEWSWKNYTLAHLKIWNSILEAMK
jgi:hypothetical protein